MTPNASEIPPPQYAGYTHTQSSGNHRVDGVGDITEAKPVDVEVPGTPVWAAGTDFLSGGGSDHSQWAVVLDDGRVFGFRVTLDGRVESGRMGPETIDGPPVVSAEAARLLTHPESSPHTHPFPVYTRLVTVGEDGTVVAHEVPDRDHERREFDVGALPDARIVAPGDTLFLFGDATDEYGHGVLGDSLEGGSIVVLDRQNDWAVSRLSPPEGTVFEGIAPIVADLEYDRPWQAIATASDAEDGARVVAIDTETEAIRSGPPIGTGNRWRHTLAVGNFGPNEEREIAAVRTPHIGGVAEFYRGTDDALELVATDDGGYQSHVLGSRNLDGGLAGQFAGDTQDLLAVPTRDRTELAVLRRVSTGVERYTMLSLGGELTTNLAGASSAGDYAIAAGVDGSVRFWVANR